MYEVYYYKTESDIHDMRLFNSKEEINEWLSRQLEIEPTTIEKIIKIKK